MPIYKGTQQVNPSDIFIGNKALQRVYVGDRLVWQKVTGPVITPVKYGLLYNLFAEEDERGLLSTDGFLLPAMVQWNALIAYLVTINEWDEYIDESGKKCKESGLEYWSFDGGINSVGFNAKGAGYRGGATFDAVFRSLKNETVFSAGRNSEVHRHCIFMTAGSDETLIDYPVSVFSGISIRPYRPATEAELLLPDGLIEATYTGNDGKIYRCTKIEALVWLADNLCETKYRNGDNIPEVTDAGVWASLETGALCAFNNDWSNV